MFDLVAKSAAEKKRVSTLIFNIVNYIQKNNWYLIDVTGNRTRWGVWNPAQINNLADWYDERGVNSMQILSWLCSPELFTSARLVSNPPLSDAANRITGQEIFSQRATQLIDQAHYDMNLVNLKIMQATDINYSDDELTFLPYMTYMTKYAAHPFHDLAVSSPDGSYLAL